MKQEFFVSIGNKAELGLILDQLWTCVIWVLFLGDVAIGGK